MLKRHSWHRVPCLSLSSFGALLELEPQHSDDSVGVPVSMVLSASGVVAEDAVVAVSVDILCSVVGLLFCGMLLSLWFL